ncbi:hypothetical protein PHJA_001738500 [Phtheirospermum japonicum]|uniref:Uncharacterized protein n=1 Tax=Phtheirospermum japonicum TaxID=374723 RepID=A0A830CI00_9LAMI|nr:hypothetical protein PHJA_001738500 [Phtheirospermum japonicum]
MPLQWKKAMNTRVSQLVNDHLHRSQKRRDGSSLLVETGFPTSLVDLFIKNREKLKKPSKKKRQNPPIPITPLTEINDPVSPPHSPMISPLITGSPLRSPPISPPPVPCEGLGESRVLGSSVGLDERECVCDTCVDANTVLLVVLKMFLVVVLALGTKRLTVGITISAFLLFFLEYVGKHVRFVSKPSLEGKGVLKSSVKSVLTVLRLNKMVKLDEKNDGVLNGPRYENHEIQVVELNRCPEIEIQPENEIIEVSCDQRRLGCQEIESDEVIGSSTREVAAELKRKSRKSKIKSKMKKLVPKKLRSSRKGPGPQSVEIVEEEDNSVVHYEDDRGSDKFGSELSSVSSRRYKEDDDKMSTVHSFSDMHEKREEIESGLNWRYLVLCVIVLAGLIGGRVFAVLLTLTWFLILKFGEKLPMIKPSNKCF